MAGVRKITLRFPKKEMLPKITKKQLEIIKYIYHFRFLNRTQIQALLKHKDYRLINEWLKDLTEKDYLIRNYSEKYGERNKPAVYYIGPNGIKLIKTLVNCGTVQLKKLHREKDRKDPYISKCQKLADIFINLKNKSNEKVLYKLTTSSGFSSPDSNYHFLAETTFDLVVEKAGGNKNKYYLAELFESTLPIHSIRKRIKNYFDFYFSNTWEDNTGEDFPIIIVICEVELISKVRKFTKTMIIENEEAENFKINIVANDDIVSNSISTVL